VTALGFDRGRALLRDSRNRLRRLAVGDCVKRRTIHSLYEGREDFLVAHFSASGAPSRWNPAAVGAWLLAACIVVGQVEPEDLAQYEAKWG
jgi:hypothetical protein